MQAAPDACEHPLDTADVKRFAHRPPGVQPFRGRREGLTRIVSRRCGITPKRGRQPFGTSPLRGP